MAKKQESCGLFRTSIGGQALIEGIMMRGPKKQSIVIRTEDGLETKVEELTFLKDKLPILGLPVIRGTVNFIDTMIKGMKALTYSASFMPEEEAGEPDKLDKWIQDHFSGETAEKIIIGVAVVLGVCLSVGLFILLPTIITGFLRRFITSNILCNLCEGAVRIILFVSYMWLVSLMKDIRRVWQYHGAEHKTIHCYEQGLELTVENARQQPRQHPRCGTSFMFIIMIVSILVFSVVSWSNVWIRMALRIVLLPIVVGISYEIIKYAGRHDNFLTAILSAPGRALQRLTTAEPDDSMLEVAIEAIRLVLPENEGEDKW